MPGGWAEACARGVSDSDEVLDEKLVTVWASRRTVSRSASRTLRSSESNRFTGSLEVIRAVTPNIDFGSNDRPLRPRVSAAESISSRNSMVEAISWSDMLPDN
jgi:hypothetical protein